MIVRTSSSRSWPFVALVTAAAVATAVPVRAAMGKAILDLFGLMPSDGITIDGQALHLRHPGASFVGDPNALNAPGSRELNVGSHEVTLTRDGCQPRTFSVSLSGTLRRDVVFAAPTPACELSVPPARH